MTVHDVFNEELLSAYLDGELSSEQRRQVEDHLATSAEHRALLEELQVLGEQLEQLPSYSLDKGFSARVIERTKYLARTQADGDAALELQSELLSAYVDGELAGDQRHFVQELLDTDVESQQLVSRLRDLDRDLHSLPKYHLDDAFAQRVLRNVQALSEHEDTVQMRAEPVTVAERPVAAESGASLRGFIWAAVTVAAALLLAFVFRGETATVPQGVVTIDTVPDVLPEDTVDPTDPQIVVDPTGPNERENTDIEQPRGPAPSGPWQFVVDFKKNAKQQLILVCEVNVTSNGVETAAFANVLRRHKIGFGDTVVVAEEDQHHLLKQRYLKGIVPAPTKTKGMDKVTLYLVTCTGTQFESIYQDLKSRPRDIGSFFLNFTTKEAGQGVLNRLCDASRIDERSSEAVELAGSFAILSQTARNLGVFGTIRWIEPDLLDPPQIEEDDQAAEQEGDPAFDKKVLEGNFACEILFVVRDLQPVDDADEPDK